MRQFEERRKLRNIFFSRPVFVLFFCLAVLVASSLYKMYKKSQEAISRYEATQEQVKEELDRKGKLEASLQELGTEAGIEKELREKFQIKKPGEDFVVIIEDEIPVQENQAAGSEKSFFQKIWGRIF